MSWFETWNHESVEALHERDRQQQLGLDQPAHPPLDALSRARAYRYPSPEARRAAMANALASIEHRMDAPMEFISRFWINRREAEERTVRLAMKEAAE